MQRLVINECTGILLLHNAQPHPGPYPQGMGVYILHNIINNIVRQAGIIPYPMRIMRIRHVCHILGMIQEK